MLIIEKVIFLFVIKEILKSKSARGIRVPFSMSIYDCLDMFNKLDISSCDIF